MLNDRRYDIKLSKHIIGYTVKFWTLETGSLDWAFSSAEDALAKVESLMVEHGDN